MLSRLAILAALFLANCTIKVALPEWTYGRFDANNTAGSMRKLYVAPPQITNMLVNEKPVAEFFAKKTEKQRASFEEDMRRYGQSTREVVQHWRDRWFAGVELVDQPSKDAFIATLIIKDIQLGWWAGLFSGHTVVQYDVEIRSPDGKVVETYSAHARTSGYSSGDRIHQAGMVSGQTLAHYLHARVNKQPYAYLD